MRFPFVRSDTYQHMCKCNSDLLSQVIMLQTELQKKKEIICDIDKETVGIMVELTKYQVFCALISLVCGGIMMWFYLT